MFDLADPGEWSQGYPTASSYFDTALPEIRPLAIDAALLAAGRLPPRRGPRFRFAELGCGSAFTLAALAATHREADFFGYDFMPEHVARARQLAEEAELGNLSVEEASFADLVTRPVPEPFDYIILYGVWTWVSAENREHLTAILDRWLRPGGIAILGYNAAAGWGPVEPIRRIFLEAPPGSHDDRFGPARAAAAAWVALTDTPHVRRVWEHLRQMPDRYLVHELAAPHGTAVWPAELANSLAPAKLEFVASANLGDRFDALYLSGERLEFVRRARAEGWGETARDLATFRSFRTDLYARGAPRLGGAEMMERLRMLTIASWPPRLEAEVGRTANAFTASFSPKVGEAVANALARGPQTIGTFADAVDLSETEAVQAALMSVARGDAALLRPVDDPGAAANTVSAFHAMLARRWRDGLGVPGVASPRLGGAVLLSTQETNVLFGADDPSDETAEGLARLGLPTLDQGVR